MILNYKIPDAFFGVVRKSFGYENGIFAALSTPLAIITNLIMNGVVREELSVSGILLKIFSEDIVQSLALVFMMFAALTLTYIMISVFDFVTGLSASKKEWTIISAGSPRGYIKSDKLWSSVWKFMAVMVIGSILTVFAMLFVFMEIDWLYDAFLLLLVFFYFTVITFDIHSIGENQERRFGKKPEFFNELEEASKMIKNLFRLRFRKVFGSENDPMPDNEMGETFNNEEDDNNIGNS